jgi:hypothetical protein
MRRLRSDNAEGSTYNRCQVVKNFLLPSSARLIRGLSALALALGFIALAPCAKADAPPSGQPIYAWTMDNIDADVLAARMPKYQDIYAKIRDQAIAAYVQAHRGSNAGDDEAKKSIKLLAYLWIWDDPFQEGLWAIDSQAAQQAESVGVDDPIIIYIADFNREAPDGDLGAAQLKQRADIFAETGYPDVFKMWYYQVVIAKIAHAQSAADPGKDTTDLSASVQKWGQLYEQQIRVPLPNGLLYAVGSGFQSEVEDNGDVLTKLHDEEDRAFAAAAPDSGVLPALDGDYLTDEAWLARSSDWASNVTNAQWAGFRNYLEKADTVLEAGYAKHPDESEISVVMLKVELGQGQGRDRMEQWFQHAIQADPQNGDAYHAKFWYLQPRWYGSEDDLVNFGKQGLDMPNPPPGALSSFAVAISQASDQDPDIYKRSEVWEPVEKNYRKYLAQYPQSIFFRTSFAKHAADSGRWSIAKEQFDLLGDNWDRGVLSDAEHARDVELANHPPSGPPPTATTAATRPVTLFSLIGRVIEFILHFIF